MMLKWLIRKRLDAFERRFDYDMSYAREMLDADARAVLTLAKVAGVSGYRRDVPVDAYYAAKLVGTLAEDCGPCTQLLITMGLRDGADPRVLHAVAAGRTDGAPSDVQLALRFAEAVLRRDPDADALREEVLARFGPRGLISLSFALVASRIFPTLKYALGHGRACQLVEVAGERVPVVRKAA